MKRLLYIAFCLAFLSGVGCAITDYGLIVDNEQAQNDQGGGVVNTNGKAHIIETNKIAFIFSPSGDTDEWLTFADQKADGARTLTSYSNQSTPLSTSFHDDGYCNPDWSGCATWTAPDPDPAAPDVSPFDGTENVNCSISQQVVGSFGALSSTGRLSECGRSLTSSDIPGEIELLTMGQYGQFQGEKGLWYDINMSNLTVNFDQKLLRIFPGKIFMNPRNGNTLVDLSNPMFMHMFKQLGSEIEPGTIISDFSVIYNGIMVVQGNNAMKIKGSALSLVHRN